jgi:hypothetical protein
MMLNAIDDQLYFATIPDLKKWFEQAYASSFRRDTFRTSHLVLQSRITQLADYSIILDQSRYAALVTARYLSPLSTEGITETRKQMYASPLPALTVFAKKDCSNKYAAVLRLQEEFSFEYAAVIG